MSRVVDSRDPAKGPGYLILQDHRDIDPDVRGAILAVRVKGRLDSGHYKVERGTWGDLLCASVWKANGDAGNGRPMPAWSWGWSVLVAQGKGPVTQAGPTDGTAAQAMYPAKGFSSDRSPDDRFATETLGYPPYWPSFPDGFSGIAIASTDEKKQRLHFHPTDPRLVAPHRGVRSLSSIVTDVASTVPDLAARLAHAVFVLNAPGIEGDGAAGGGGTSPTPSGDHVEAAGADAGGSDRSAESADIGLPLGSSASNTFGIGTPAAGGAKKGTLEQNRLALLAGWSNEFHGGFLIDNQTHGAGGSGPVTLAGQGGNAPDRPFDPSKEPKNSPFAGPNSSTNIQSGGSGPNFQYQLPPGAGNLARQQPINGPVVSPYGATPTGQPALKYGIPVPVTGLKAVAPKAHTLADLGIHAGRSNGGKIVTQLSANYAGPFHTGGANDVHRIGTDGDGNPINPQHLSINALFYADEERDGPFAWWKDFYKGTTHEVPLQVFMAFDGDQGRWGWWTSIPYDRVTPSTPENKTPRGPITKYNQPPPWKVSSMGGDGSGRMYVSSHNEFATAVLIGRPQDQRARGTDLRVSVASLEELEGARENPIVARIEAFGPQLTGEWQRNTDVDRLYRGGTAAGGFVVLPPESRVEDLNPYAVTLSETYFAIGPGVRLAFGTPLLDTGGVATGWSVRGSGSDLVFNDHTTTGDKVDRLSLVNIGGGDLGLQVKTALKSLKLQDSAGNTVIQIQGADKLAFHGSTPITKATVSGSRADTDAALANLLTALANLGLITDGTSV